MAQLNDLLVTGQSRFLNDINGNLVGNVTGNASSATYATNSGTSNYAPNAGTATYANSATNASSATVATSAGVGTDSTKLPLAGGALTGAVTNTGTFKSYNTADADQYVMMGYADLINGKKWDGTNTSLVSALSGKLSTNGGTMTGNIIMNGKDLVLGTTGSGSNDSGDIVFTYGNGSEKARIYTSDTYSSTVGPGYRIFNSSGTQLYSGRLLTENGSVDIGTITSYSNTKVSGGSLVGYRYGNIVVIKINGISFSGVSGRATFCTLGTNYRPPAQMTSGTIITSTGAKLYFLANADGTFQFDASTTLTWTAYINFAYIAN